MYHFDDPHSQHNINNILILVSMDGAVKFPFYPPPTHSPSFSKGSPPIRLHHYQHRRHWVEYRHHHHNHDLNHPHHHHQDRHEAHISSAVKLFRPARHPDCVAWFLKCNHRFVIVTINVVPHIAIIIIIHNHHHHRKHCHGLGWRGGGRQLYDGVWPNYPTGWNNGRSWKNSEALNNEICSCNSQACWHLSLFLKVTRLPPVKAQLLIISVNRQNSSTTSL